MHIRLIPSGVATEMNRSLVLPTLPLLLVYGVTRQVDDNATSIPLTENLVPSRLNAPTGRTIPIHRHCGANVNTPQPVSFSANTSESRVAVWLTKTIISVGV